MNICILIGRLTKDAEYTETSAGKKVCRLSIAVDRDFANASGEKETDFFNIVVWGNRAESCAKYLKKGKRIAVEGRIQNRAYEDREGIKRSVTEIVAMDVKFLSPKSTDIEPEEEVAVRKERPQLEPIDDDDLPF